MLWVTHKIFDLINLDIDLIWLLLPCLIIDCEIYQEMYAYASGTFVKTAAKCIRNIFDL